MVVVVAVVGAVDHQVSSVDDEMRVEKIEIKTDHWAAHIRR